MTVVDQKEKQSFTTYYNTKIEIVFFFFFSRPRRRNRPIFRNLYRNTTIFQN